MILLVDAAVAWVLSWPREPRLWDQHYRPLGSFEVRYRARGWQRCVEFL